MGLGKTLISLIWAQTVSRLLSHSCLTLVVAPCTLIDNWKREAAAVGFHILDKKNISPPNMPCIAFESWAKVPSRSELDGRLHRARFSSFIVIGDEAHAMQSFSSQRTKAMIALCHDSKCLGVVLSTGTPMKNGRPCNLLPLLVAIRHPIAASRVTYEKRYCNARKTRFCAWDTSGASNLGELRAKIGPYILRKTKVTFLLYLPLICTPLPLFFSPLVPFPLNLSPSPHFFLSSLLPPRRRF